MEEKIYLFAGKRYTLGEFAEDFKEGNLEEASALLEILLKTGKARELPNFAGGIEQQIINDALREVGVLDVAESLTAEEIAEKKFRVDKKRENKLTYPEVAFEFATVSKAESFEDTLTDMFINCSVQKNTETKLWEVVVNDVTEGDLTKISNLYKTQRVVDGTLFAVDDMANKTVNTVSYASEKVIVPTVQVAGKAGMSIFKTLAKTAVKTGSTLTSAVVHGVRDTVKEVKTDPDVIKASADLKKTTLDVKNSFGGSKAAKISSGIHFR